MACSRQPAGQNRQICLDPTTDNYYSPQPSQLFSDLSLETSSMSDIDVPSCMSHCTTCQYDGSSLPSLSGSLTSQVKSRAHDPSTQSSELRNACGPEAKVRSRVCVASMPIAYLRCLTTDPASDPPQPSRFLVAVTVLSSGQPVQPSSVSCFHPRIHTTQL